MEKQPLTAFCLNNKRFYDSNIKSYQLKDLSLEQCPNIIRVKPYKEIGK